MSFVDSSQATETFRKEDEILSIPMMDDKIIYKGDLVLIDVSGYARPVYETGAPGDCFAGVAAETVDNTTDGHTTGGKSVRVYRTGSFVFHKTGGSAAQADVGIAVYTDPGGSGTPTNVTTAAAHAAYVGIVSECVDDTHLRVSIATNVFENIALDS